MLEMQQSHWVKMALGFLTLVLFISISKWIFLSFSLAKPPVSKAGASLGEMQVFAPSPLFGQSPTSGVLEQTHLNLTLKGTFAASQPLTGSAVISAPDTGDKVYVVNDNLPGGAVVKEIYPDYVVLTYQGKEQVLRLPENGLLTQ